MDDVYFEWVRLFGESVPNLESLKDPRHLIQMLCGLDSGFFECLKPRGGSRPGYREVIERLKKYQAVKIQEPNAGKICNGDVSEIKRLLEFVMLVVLKSSHSTDLTHKIKQLDQEVQLQTAKILDPLFNDDQVSLSELHQLLEDESARRVKLHNELEWHKQYIDQVENELKRVQETADARVQECNEKTVELSKQLDRLKQENSRLKVDLADVDQQSLQIAKLQDTVDKYKGIVEKKVRSQSQSEVNSTNRDMFDMISVWYSLPKQANESTAIGWLTIQRQRLYAQSIRGGSN